MESKKFLFESKQYLDEDLQLNSNERMNLVKKALRAELINYVIQNNVGNVVETTDFETRRREYVMKLYILSPEDFWAIIQIEAKKMLDSIEQSEIAK